MEDQQTQPNVEQAEQEFPVDERQPWERPKLEQLHVSLDTSADPGSASDGPAVGSSV